MRRPSLYGIKNDLVNWLLREECDAIKVSLRAHWHCGRSLDLDDIQDLLILVYDSNSNLRGIESLHLDEMTMLAIKITTA